MAIAYPIDLPANGITSIEWRALNAVATSQSPFTYKQQVIAHGGQRWEATVNIAPLNKAAAAAWKASLISLKGSVGTMLLGNPVYDVPQGTVSACTLSGDAGVETASVTMTGSLKAGDYIQLGAGSSAKLHQVLVDQTGDGSLEIWPALRTTYSSQSVVFNAPKGLFRLSQNMTSWSIDNASIYGISFDAVEALT